MGMRRSSASGRPAASSCKSWEMFGPSAMSLPCRDQTTTSTHEPRGPTTAPLRGKIRQGDGFPITPARRQRMSAHRSRFIVLAFAALTAALGCNPPNDQPITGLQGPAFITMEGSEWSTPVNLADAALFIGNLVPAVPGGNGILRYDGRGNLIDAFTPGGCCMTFGPGEHLYVTRQRAVERYNGVTGEFMDIFVAPDPNS